MIEFINTYLESFFKHDDGHHDIFYPIGYMDNKIVWRYTTSSTQYLPNMIEYRQANL